MMRKAEAAAREMVLAYHEIMLESTYAYCVTTQGFREHLFLLKALAAHDGIGTRITFDDGEQTQYQNAAPLLTEQRISATYFVTPGLAGTEPKFLSWAQLKQLQAEGHSVQSHGHSHRFLTSCSAAELADEVAGSKQMLEDKLGVAIEEISIPGGRWDERVIEACAHAGYKRVFVSEPWIDAQICGLNVIGRFMVRRTTTVADLEKMARKDLRTLRKMKIRAALRRGVVGLVGDGLYHRLWCRLTGYNEFEAVRQGR